ncbi:MAG: hypothetical protein C0507_07075 [Cyanobacteria bacterium PR.3.49]|nr:hypothetical protein [Cyanobacteria bacterium PR.3.49]
MKLLIAFLSLLLCCLLAPQTSFAQSKFNAILITSEQTMVKTNHEPEKLISKVLTDDFNKGKMVRIVTRDNPQPGQKLQSAKYAVDAKLNALVLMPGAPAELSLHLNLTNVASTEIVALSQTIRRIDSKMLEDGSNLSAAELAKSEFGKLLMDLVHEAVKTFEAKLEKVKIS